MQITKFLVASRILDQDETLSISSILMLVLVVKIAIAPALDLPTVASLFLALANYTGKKVINLKKEDLTAKQDSKLDDHIQALAEVKASVASLQSASSQQTIMNQIMGR